MYLGFSAIDLRLGGYSNFQTSMMLLLSSSTGCYSNTLIDADTNVPIKNIVLILRQFFFLSKFSSFCWWGVQHLLACGLRYYLGRIQILIRGNSKIKFAVKGRGLGYCCKETFFRQWEGLRCGCPNFLFQ